MNAIRDRVSKIEIGAMQSVHTKTVVRWEDNQFSLGESRPEALSTSCRLTFEEVVEKLANLFGTKPTIDLQNITGDNAASVVKKIEEAYAKLPIAKFCELLNDSGCSVSGTKRAMLDQARNFVNRLAVTEVQCRF